MFKYIESIAQKALHSAELLCFKEVLVQFFTVVVPDLHHVVCTFFVDIECLYSVAVLEAIIPVECLFIAVVCDIYRWPHLTHHQPLVGVE